MKHSNLRKVLITTFLHVIFFLNAFPQWLDGYKYRIPISVSSISLSVSSDLLDFPLKIDFESGRIKTQSNGGQLMHENGWDIRFTASDGISLLDHDMDSQDVVNGRILAWVRIPNLSATEDTEIYMYFSHPGVNENPSTTDTWPSEYLGVWHMELAGVDASRHGNNAKVLGTSDGPEKIGLSRSFDGVDDYLLVPYNLSLQIDQGICIETWIQIGDDDEIAEAIFTKEDDYTFWYAKEILRFTIAGKSLEKPFHFEDNTWYHVYAIYDRSFMRLFVDGTEIGSLANTSAVTNNANTEVIIGDYTFLSAAEFYGYMDEMRMSTQIPSIDWIRTNYRNQTSTSFYSMGTVERNNDLPCRAIELTVGTTCEFGVFGNQNAGDSGIPLIECSEYSGADVWFSLEVPASGAVRVELDNTTTPEIPNPSSWMVLPGLAVYSGSCTTPVHDTCWISFSPDSVNNLPSIQLSDYTPGETIWLRIWGYGGETGYFKICASLNEEAPSIECSGTVSSATDPDVCTAFVTVPVPLTGGANPLLILENDYNGTGDASDTYPAGSTVVNWTLTDISNNTSSCQDTIEVFDAQGPLINCPDDLIHSLDDICSFALPDYDSLITVTDNCDPDPTFTQSPLPGTELSGSGTTQKISLLANDSEGNESTCQFTITLQDQSPPEAVSLTDTMVVVPDGTYQVHVDVPLPVFSDNCGIDGVDNDIYGGPDASGIYLYGATTVTYTVQDINGNEAQFTQLVQVEMENAPEHGLVIPDAFSPNEDGYNDRLVILGLESYTQNELRVFNVNGQEVFRMESYDSSWDGTGLSGPAKGKKLPVGNYFYVLYLEGSGSVIKGTVYIRQE